MKHGTERILTPHTGSLPRQERLAQSALSRQIKALEKELELA
jgi:hypothetical protein